MRTTVRCQNGSGNNYRTKPTSAWALVANGMNFELLFTTEEIPPSRWVSNSSCKRRLERNRQSIPSTTQRHYYNNLPAETFFKGQRTRLGNIPSIYYQPTEAQLRVNIYCIFLFQMGGNLECIRYCIYDSTASPCVPQSSCSFTQTQPLFFCVTSCHICSAR